MMPLQQQHVVYIFQTNVLTKKLLRLRSNKLFEDTIAVQRKFQIDNNIFQKEPERDS